MVHSGRTLLKRWLRTWIRAERGESRRCLSTSAHGAGRRLISTGLNAIHVPASDAGCAAIVFLRDRVLLAQRFDEQRLELKGEPVPLAVNVGSYPDYAFTRHLRAFSSPARPIHSAS
jgi:hypothetical protein